MKNKLLIVACLVIVLSMALILPLSIVNADYSDIVNDPNSIVNFNQYISQPVTNYAGSGIVSITQFNYNANHKCYIKTNIPEQYTTNVALGNGSNIYEYIKGSYIFQYSGSLTINSIIFNSGLPNGTYYINFIDLTQMFGSNDNIPTLEQCINLFVADYYNYNTGTAMSFGSVNAYQQALSDITNSYSFNLSVSALGLNSFAYNYKNVTSTFAFNQQYNFWYYENTFGTPLFTTLSSGTKLNLEFNFYASNSGYQPHLHLAVWYLNNQSDLVNIYKDPHGINYYSDEVNNISFVLPTSVDTLYFNVYDDRTQAVDTASNSFVLLFNITAQQFDLNSAITNAFITGQKTVMSSYQVGGDKYQEIWQSGYINGLNAETPYTFANLMSSVVEAPLNAVLSIFNFDFLGYNFRNVITLILTLCIILSIIRLFIGMGGSE